MPCRQNLPLLTPGEEHRAVLQEMVYLLSLVCSPSARNGPAGESHLVEHTNTAQFTAFI